MPTVLLRVAWLGPRGEGMLIVEVFRGLRLLPLGLLVSCSGWFPSIRTALSPVLTVLIAIGGIPSLRWLLIRGARSAAATQAIASPA